MRQNGNPPGDANLVDLNPFQQPNPGKAAAGASSGACSKMRSQDALWKEVQGAGNAQRSLPHARRCKYGASHPRRLGTVPASKLGRDDLGVEVNINRAAKL